jgi:hypothetical protein
VHEIKLSAPLEQNLSEEFLVGFVRSTSVAAVETPSAAAAAAHTLLQFMIARF